MADRPDKREAAAKATAQYEAEAAALRAKTARLRELRMAHEAANPAPVKPAPAAKRTGAKTKSGKAGASSQTVSEWLTVLQNQGRRS